MELLASYLFWTSIYIAIVAMLQWSILRRSSDPAQNRWFILPGLVTALFMGLFSLLPAQSLLGAGQVSVYLLPEVVAGTSHGLEYSQQGIYEAFSTQRMVFSVTLGISLILLVRLLVSVFFLLFRIRLSRKITMYGCTILPVNKQTGPFSFFGFVFVPEPLLSDKNLYTILLHEKAHMLKKHSIDLILLEILTILFWFHPGVWYLRRELKMQHEYEADRYVLKAICDKKAYQELLLDLSFYGCHLPVTNSINYPPLKKRIMMMNKTSRKNRFRAFIAILMIIPLFTMIWLLQSCEQKPANDHEQKEAVTTADQVEEEEEDEDVIFTVVEEMPEFPGGEDARQTFMQENLEYPREAKQAGIQGTVFVSFVVEEDGSISNVEVLRGVGGGLDEEAVRVVKAMPDWKPGRQRGNDVQVQFNMPVRFQLDQDEGSDESISDDEAN